MATDSQHDGAAQCDVPDITFTSESTTFSPQNLGNSTPNTPVLLLAKPREGLQQQQLNQEATTAIQTVRTRDSGPPIALLQRPLSAPTSLVSHTAPSTSQPNAQPTAGTLSDSAPAMDIDSPIVDALKSSKDRLYVLKLGETMENLISQGKLYAQVELQPASTYQRLLIHRCAAFYHLTQESSSSTSTVSVIVTADSRIPSKRISELVPPEETVLPAFQIMRRVDRPKTVSRATSVDGNLTDEGDETRSQGSGSKKKVHRTIEEREADYHKARSRIFMDFEEKDAASSGGAVSSAASIVSYTGGSTGMSSVDGDGASIAPTESEYSAPAGRVKEAWSTSGSYAGSNGRGKQASGASHSAGSMRPSAPPFTSPNVSPPFPPQGTVHYIPDPTVSAAMPPPPPPSVIHGPPSRPASQASHQSNSSYDQRAQGHSHHPPSQPYQQQPINQNTFPSPPSYTPQHPSGPPPPNPMPPNQNRSVKNPNPPPSGHPPGRNVGPTIRPTASINGVPNLPLANHHAGNVPPSNPTQLVHNTPWNQQSTGGPGELVPNGPARPGENNRSGGGAPSSAGGSSLPGRGMARNPWGNYSYGPGVGIGGMQTVNAAGPNTTIPRAPDGLNIRILPPITLDNHSTGSSNGSSSSARKRNAMGGNTKTLGDETSSVTSSSSSSSKRTFTSNASSQPPQHHPLPERPDWVLGARPGPGGTMQSRNKAVPPSVGVARPSPSPSTAPSSQLDTTSSVSSVAGSDSKEFPPLGSGSDGRGGTSPGGPGQVSRSKAATSPTNAWNNALTSSPARSAATVSGPASLPPRPAVGSTGRPDGIPRLDDVDTGFERPPPKSGAALFNPHVPTRSKSGDQQQTTGVKASSAVDPLSQKLGAVTLLDNGQGPPRSAGKMDGGVIDASKETSGTTE
ncbi:hypothetical protein FRC17_005418 [Serendipita sp. 399]|nr:hypothetical protein FRC17_005418 [Serendipita sp. 399]